MIEIIVNEFQSSYCDNYWNLKHVLICLLFFFYFVLFLSFCNMFLFEYIKVDNINSTVEDQEK